MRRKQVSLQQMLKRLEAIKAELHKNKESHRQAIAFRNYASVRYLQRNVIDMITDLKEWCRMLEESGAIVENTWNALFDAADILVEALRKDMERNARLCSTKYVELPCDYTPDSLVDLLEHFKQVFYDRETFRHFEANGFFDGFEWCEWRRGTPISSYALNCFLKAAKEEDALELPLPAIFYDRELNAVVLDFYGWLEILPLSDWQYEELCRRGEISKNDNDSGK